MGRSKQSSYDINFKIAVIQAINSGKKCSLVAEEFHIPRSTLSTFLRDKDKIYASVASGSVSSKTKRLRTAKYENLETELLQWFKNVRHNNVSLSGPIIRIKAKEIADRLKISDFQFSDGWFARFKKRHNITSQKVCGEANKISEETADEWIKSFLMILENYDPDDVFNMDESGMFFNLQPDRTLNIKGDRCHGGSKSKQRVTAVFCCNSTGTEKFKPWIIGKFEKPHCLRGLCRQTLPCDYSHQSRSWIDAVAFRKWLLKLNERMVTQNRKILLTLDNCSAHNIENLKLPNVNVQFFPPNFTSRLQPLDQGIIALAKRHFRHRLVCASVEAINRGKEIPKWNILDTIRNVAAAWKSVTAEAIKNCFRKAWTPSDSSPTSCLQVELDEPWNLEWDKLYPHFSPV